MVVAVLASWSFQPLIVVGVILAAALYTIGWRRLQRRSRVTIVAAWQAWCYVGGLAAIVVALLSPISTFSALFFFLHMIEHLLLLLIAPPPLWLGAPLLPVLWALPMSLRRPLGRLGRNGQPLQRIFHTLTKPPIALAGFCIIMGTWHIPPLYDLAEGATVIHWFEHGTMLAAGLAFWWPVVGPGGSRRRFHYGATILYLVPPMFEGTAIGALLTLAKTPIYPYYTRVPRLWGMSVLQDQALGGYIMWVPGGLVFLITILILFFRWFEDEERRQNPPRRTAPAITSRHAAPASTTQPGSGDG